MFLLFETGFKSGWGKFCLAFSLSPCFCVSVCAALVVRVRALSVVHVAGQHVVVHVNGAAVVDGVAQPLGHDGLAGVGRQAQLEEARLGCRQAVVRLHGTETDGQMGIQSDKQPGGLSQSTA